MSVCSVRPPVNLPAVCDVLLEGEVDPEQSAPVAERAVEVPVACFIVPHKNLAERL